MVYKSIELKQGIAMCLPHHFGVGQKSGDTSVQLWIIQALAGLNIWMQCPAPTRKSQPAYGFMHYSTGVWMNETAHTNYARFF